jgi:hypothetical protein
MLGGFTRPFRRLTEVLQGGVVPAGVSPIFVARYPDGVKALHVPSDGREQRIGADFPGDHGQ